MNDEAKKELVKLVHEDWDWLLAQGEARRKYWEGVWRAMDKNVIERLKAEYLGKSPS